MNEYIIVSTLSDCSKGKCSVVDIGMHSFSSVHVNFWHDMFMTKMFLRCWLGLGMSSHAGREHLACQENVSIEDSDLGAGCAGKRY